MPKYKHSKGYDRLEYWTRMELRRLYQNEGYSTKEAIKMANAVYEAIRNLNRQELYSWNKARELERLYGVGKSLHELGSTNGNESLGTLWEEIEGRAPSEERGREIAHYEKLRGKRMRLDPGEKGERAEKRLQEKQRKDPNLGIDWSDYIERELRKNPYYELLFSGD